MTQTINYYCLVSRYISVIRTEAYSETEFIQIAIILMTIRKGSHVTPFQVSLMLCRLAWFQQFQQAPVDSPLAKKGLSFIGIDSFLSAAANGMLPAVSYIIGQTELSEHPPWQPNDGAYIQALIANAVINSPKYNSTVLIISYDETGGWADQYVHLHCVLLF